MTPRSVVVLCGGVGGAKLALGLYRTLPSGSLTAVVNTGDDFEHLGLRISPDVDTLLYTLAGIANPSTGWGRRDESWQCMQALEALGGETWFQLGDRDLAMHLRRTQWLAEGGTLSHFVRDIAARLGIAADILPMSDQWVQTELDTDRGRLSFQAYFVRQACEPTVRALHYTGARAAKAAPGIVAALQQGNPEAVIIAPSNPYLSVAPMLAVPEIHNALLETRAPVVAVSPVIGDCAVKGPTAKIMRELRLPPSAITVAEYYGDLIDGFVVDSRDEQLAKAMPVPSLAIDTLMVSVKDRERVARSVLTFAQELKKTHRASTGER